MNYINLTAVSLSLLNNFELFADEKFSDNMDTIYCIHLLSKQFLRLDYCWTQETKAGQVQFIADGDSKSEIAFCKLILNIVPKTSKFLKNTYQ